jgi:hypothetical protein
MLRRKRLPSGNWRGHKARTFYGPFNDGCIKESRDTVMGIRAILSRDGGHHLAKLVYQGSNPRLPHQAWVTREG